MKRYNEKLLKATKITTQNILKKSNASVNKFTHPPKKVALIGSKLGLLAGTGLLITGTAGTILGYVWGVAGCIAGVTTVISNIINIRKFK